MTAPAVLAWRHADRWVTRAHAARCACTTDAALECVCHGRCECHAPESGPVAVPTSYATVPPGLVLGDGLLRTVRCYLCGSKLTPGRVGWVTRERYERWRHGKASGTCERKGRVEGAEGLTLEGLLRESVEVRRG